jgi:hypothetical protein
MIKFSTRGNIKFPLQLLLWNILRKFESSLISYFLGFDNSLIFTPLMFLGEFSAGLIIYLYQKKFLQKQKNSEKIKNKSITLIVTEQYLKAIDSKTKIFFLIFNSALFDFVQFGLSLHTPKFVNVTGSIETRLAGFLTIFDALFYLYVLRFNIYRHQKFSLIGIGICLFLIIFSEFFFQDINIFLTYGQFVLVILLIFVVQFCSAMVDSIEKYLFEYNQLNQFLALMFEGIFGFVLTVIYAFFYNPFDDIVAMKKNNSTGNFVMLILSLILYLILSGVKNAFRVTTTKIYSPMTTTFMDYILNPFYLTYDFASGLDYFTNGEINYAYFILNLILSIIISFLGCVYNEFLILFCFGLERDTYNQITKRSFTEQELITINNVIEPDEEDII